MRSIISVGNVGVGAQLPPSLHALVTLPKYTVISPHFSFEQVIRTLEEPTAAALAFGLHRKPSVNHILVYDLGGGTLDVSLLFVNDGSVEVLGSDGDDNLGGEFSVAHS